VFQDFVIRAFVNSSTCFAVYSEKWKLNHLYSENLKIYFFVDADDWTVATSEKDDFAVFHSAWNLIITQRRKQLDDKKFTTAEYFAQFPLLSSADGHYAVSVFKESVFILKEIKKLRKVPDIFCRGT
jgi:hypothetical protein